MSPDLELPSCLIVDDLEENLLALQALLKDEKMKIFTASSGNEALELLLQHEFALALLDVQMPGMNGIELAEIMRSTSKTRQIPIVFVTAGGASAQKVFQGYEAGAVDFLHKPLVPQVVLGKIRIFLELYNHKKLLEKKIKKLRDTENHLKNSLMMRDEFVSICSHELKTPLTTLKMNLQMQERNRKKMDSGDNLSVEKLDKFFRQSRNEVDRMIHLVNDMLDMARVNSGRFTLIKEEVEISSLVFEVVERLEPLMRENSCPTHFIIKDEIRCMIDKFRIEQVITNLLSNAAKYAPGSEVEVRVAHKEAEVEICIKDSGPGICKENQEKIFNRFERAVSQSSTVSGLGLGLYISKEIIDLHQGKIILESELGKGTAFKVYLPIYV